MHLFLIKLFLFFPLKIIPDLSILIGIFDISSGIIANLWLPRSHDN